MCFFVMWPTQWYNYCAIFPLKVRAVGVFLFPCALLALHALPYFPAGNAETLFTSSFCHGLTADSRVPNSGQCTTPACFTHPHLRFSGSGTTPLFPPNGSNRNPDCRPCYDHRYYGLSPLPLSLSHVALRATSVCNSRHEMHSVAGMTSRPPPFLDARLRERGTGQTTVNKKSPIHYHYNLCK